MTSLTPEASAYLLVDRRLAPSMVSSDLASEGVVDSPPYAMLRHPDLGIWGGMLHIIRFCCPNSEAVTSARIEKEPSQVRALAWRQP